MKLFLGNVKTIEKELENIIDKINNCNEIDDAIILIASYELLQEIYKSYTNQEYNEKELNYDESLFDKATNIYNSIYKKRDINYIKNKKYFLDFSSLTLSIILDDIYYLEQPVYEKLDEDNIYKIISDYYKYKNDTEGLEIFNSLIKNRRIHNYNYNDDSVFASTIYNYSELKPHVLLFNNNMTTIVLPSLIHEIEHIKDFDNLIENKSLLDSINYQLISIYPEVLALKKELDFIEYLYDNNIHKEEAKAMLDKFYIDIFMYLNQLVILSLLDEEYLNDNKYMDLTKEELINNIKKKNIDIDPTSINMNYDIDDELLYGIGGVLAVFFSYLEKNDNERYKICFNNFMNLRYDEFHIYDLERIGTTVEELGNILSNQIKNNQKDYKISKIKK